MSSTASSQSTPNSEISAKEVRGASLHPYQQANAVEKSGVQHRVVSSNTIDINQPIHLSGAALSFDPRNGHVNSGLAEKPLSKKQRKKRNKARREATANASSANASTPTDLEACFAAFTIDTGLKTGSKKHRQARSAFIVREFSAYFGADCRLDNWLMLCDDLGIDTYGLTSITKCKKALNSVWVNIWDFLDAKRAGVRPHLFRNRNELVNYTIKNGRLYPKAMAKECGPVKCLLTRLF